MGSRRAARYTLRGDPRIARRDRFGLRESRISGLGIRHEAFTRKAVHMKIIRATGHTGLRTSTHPSSGIGAFALYALKYGPRPRGAHVGTLKSVRRSKWYTSAAVRDGRRPKESMQHVATPGALSPEHPCVARAVPLIRPQHDEKCTCSCAQRGVASSGAARDPRVH